MEKIADYIIAFLLKRQLMDKEDANVYHYALCLVLLYVANILTLICVGIVLKQVVVILLFLLFFIPLRTTAGGYHCKTRLHCYLCSVLSVSILLVLEQKLSIVIQVIAAISLIPISVLVPMESHNKPLELWEKEKYKHKARIYLLIYLLVYFFVRFYEIVRVQKALEMAVGMVGVLVFASVLEEIMIKGKNISCNKINS